MSNPQLTLKLLKHLVSKAGDPTVSFRTFEAHVKRFAEKSVSKQPALSLFATNTATVLTADLEELASRGECSLDYREMRIEQIHYPRFFIDYLQSQFRQIEGDPALPFPTTDSIQVKIPDNLIKVVNVKNDFVTWLGYEEMANPVIIRLEFPEGFKNILMPSTVFFNTLLPLSLEKIRLYMRDQANMKYAFNKLMNVFGNKELVLKQFLEDIAENPARTADTISTPTEFTFRAWTTLANLIIHDIKIKASKLAEEISLCQAAYLIGYYNVANKTRIREQQDEETSYKQLETAVKKAPYFFTINEIYNLKNEKGVPFVKKCGREMINGFIKEKTKMKDKQSFPELILIKTEQGKEYFICKEAILGLTLQKIEAVRTEIERELLDTWIEALKNFKKFPEMKDDEKYESGLGEKLKEKDPLLNALLRFDLLYVLATEADVSPRLRAGIEEILDPHEQELMPPSGILDIPRSALFSDARNRLPLWQTTPLISTFVQLFMKMFSKPKQQKPVKKSAPKSKKQKVSSSSKSSASARSRGTSTSGKGKGKGGKAPNPSAAAKAKLIKFREEIGKLKSQYISSNENIDHSIEGLIDKWNHLIDPNARGNLVEDVNSAIRDYMRRFKRTLIENPPSKDELQTMAMRLAEQPIFREIKHKEPFWRYIELYFLKLLGKE